MKKFYLYYGPVLLSLALCIVVMVAFNLFLNKSIESTATKTLEISIRDDRDEFYNNDTRNFFDVYAITKYDIENDVAIFTELELYNYYEQNADSLAFDSVHTYKTDRNLIYFMPIQDYFDNYKDANNVRLEYINLSPLIGIIATVNKTLALTMLVGLIIITIVNYKRAKAIEKSQQDTKRFFENASHELKTPITAIKSYAEGLKDGYINNDLAVNTILKQSDKMEELVGNILEISKLDSGILQPKINYGDLREVAYEAIDNYQLKAEASGINLTFKLDTTLFANFDENMAYSILSNLISNSLRYAASIVSLEGFYKDNNVVIKVINDGETIADTTKVNMFDRFYKGDKGQSGIGLSLVKEYISLMKGDIQIESNNNKTIFIWQQPIK